MTTETETNINKALEWLQQTGGAIQDFASEQAPLYCQEVVAWELWSSAFFSGIGFMLILLAAFSAFKFSRWVDGGGEDFISAASGAVALVCVILGPSFVLINAPSAIKAAVSPRLVIVEHLNKLRK